MATFESMDRRMPKIEACLKANGLESLDACNEMLLAKGIDCDKIVRGVQPICFDNAVWAYTLGTAIAVKRGLTDAAECAAAIGEGLEAFTIPGSVAEQRQVGLGHGNLGARLLSEDTTCFAFLAGHESFAAAEGAIGIARTANKVRKTPLRVILNGLVKDAAYIISRINGFTYVQTEYDIPTQTLTVVKEIPFSEGERAAVKCYGANDVMEGVAIMKKETSTAPSPATPPTPSASSTWLQAPIRSGPSRTARSTSPLLPAAARAVPCTPITWQQAPQATA